MSIVCDPNRNKRFPGVEIAKGKMEVLYSGLIETLNPEAKGPIARAAGSEIAQNFFEEAHRQHVRWDKPAWTRRTHFMKLGKEASIEFLKQMEKGVQFKNPELEQFRLAYRAWTDEMIRQDELTYAKAGKDLPYDALEHYVPRQFEDGPAVIKFFDNKYKGRKWADPRFIRTRKFELLQEALDAGYSLKEWNPEVIMQQRQFASDIAELRSQLLDDMTKRGIAIEAFEGQEIPPDGSYHRESWRAPTGQRYWVKEEAYPVMKTALDSKSLWNLQETPLQRAISTGFRGWMGAKNRLVPFKLAWSLFHPFHVTHIDAAAELTRLQVLMAGNPTSKNVANMLQMFVTGTPTNPLGATGIAYRAWWDNPKTGYPLLRAFQGRRSFSSLSEVDKAAYRDMAEGGLVPTRPKEETDNAVQKFKDAIYQRHVGRATFELPWVVMHGLGYPIYNLWIPTLKIASYLKDTKVWRELNPTAPDFTRQEAFRRIARHVESRYGEMNYQAMFMNRYLRDIGVASNLSLGWNLGFLDVYAGGAIDAVKTVTTKDSVKSKLAKGQFDKPLYLLNYTISGLAIGGLMTYWLAKQMPQSILDYTNPLSGEKDSNGKPIRLNTPMFTHEFSSLYKHAQQEGIAAGVSDFLWAKGSGIYEMAKSSWTGINSLHQEIRDGYAPAYKQLEETLAYELGDLNAMSLKALNLAPDANAAKMRALAVVGFGPAGKYISESAVEGKISTEFNKTRPQQQSYNSVQLGKDTKQLRELYKRDDSTYEQFLESTKQKYGMDDKDIHRMEKMFGKEETFDPSVYMFSKLEYAKQLNLLKEIKEPEERERYLAHVGKEKRRKLEEALEE